MAWIPEVVAEFEDLELRWECHCVCIKRVWWKIREGGFVPFDPISSVSRPFLSALPPNCNSIVPQNQEHATEKERQSNTKEINIFLKGMEPLGSEHARVVVAKRACVLGYPCASQGNGTNVDGISVFCCRKWQENRRRFLQSSSPVLETVDRRGHF